ncbi:hypothetical protein [Paraburkholderia sp. SIMBA_054]|uniref:hypothetical protein n=1 Tax=Paraburkholderia sp. SIMBA_054 TaxID=3085795 RepID=UPI003979012C
MEQYFVSRRSAVRRIVAERQALIKDQEQRSFTVSRDNIDARLAELSRLLVDVRAARLVDIQVPTAGGGRVRLLVTVE